MNKEAAKGKQLNIYMDLKDKESTSIIKFITDEYKKDNPESKINITNALGGNIEEDIGKSNENDIIITSRNNMLKLSRKGFLSDMGNYYEDTKINDKYYRIISAYGRVEDKYYGMALIPYTIEILYNKNALDKLNVKIPSSMNDLKDVLKKINVSSSSIPVLLTEDLDVNIGLSSYIFVNRVSMRKLESKYDSGADAYKSLKEMQQAFDTIGDWIKGAGINKNTFEIGNETSINKFVKGDIPLIVCSSYYANSLKGDNLKIIEENVDNPALRINVPIICNAIICTHINDKNGEEVSNFIKYIFGEELQKKLVKKGFISGNKKANSSINDKLKTSIVKHLENSTEDSVIFVYNMPERLKSSIASKLEQMINGKITKKEWEEAVDDAYK
ncbi:carbohydrate ABC transporter substrate-binding protein [Clostridium sp. DJ247]|nr:carbohydrate ABC transporter substrate-binding protein [Clostridium sp. DJ247]